MDPEEQTSVTQKKETLNEAAARLGVKTVKLYHGTNQYYQGPPTRGGRKDTLLQSNYISMTPYEDGAEFFTGGGNPYSRVYSLDVPVESILDIRNDYPSMSKKSIREAFEKARQDGYTAVAIPDYTFGGDAEFRLVGQVPEEAWSVRRTEQSVKNYAAFEEVIKKVEEGKPITERERKMAKRELEHLRDETWRVIHDFIDVVLHTEADREAFYAEMGTHEGGLREAT